MGKGVHYDFQDFNPDFERVVEIYNAWGSSEMIGGARPITGNIEQTAVGSIVEALKRNCRFGFVGGGLDDRGIYQDCYESDQVQYSPGMTGIICEKYTRESMLEGLMRRSCYATTGPKIILGFYIAGQRMGSELSTATKPGLQANRHISGYVASATKLKQIEIIRNGTVLHLFHPQGHHFDYYYDDQESPQQIALDGRGKDPFVFYYLRVTQEDGHMAWSSPIWIDFLSSSTRPIPRKQESA
jgi:hypothetical protein